MHAPHWMKNTNQLLLPAASVGGPAPTEPRGRWCALGGLLACAVIFGIDVVIPGVVVGLLYSLVVLGMAPLGRASWLLFVCGLGTVFHAIAGVFDVAAVDPVTAAANRVLAIVVLWAIGGLAAYNIAMRRSLRRPWTTITID